MHEETVEMLLKKVQDPDPVARMTAAHEAGPVGSGAVLPLGDLLTNADPGIAKAADEALKRITHYAARPGAPHAERSAVAEALVRLTDSRRPEKVRDQAVRLLQNVAGDAQVSALAKLLDDPKLREDARLTLEPIPGSASLRALETAGRSAVAEFRPHVEQSLHHRRLAARTIGIREA